MVRFDGRDFTQRMKAACDCEMVRYPWQPIAEKKVDIIIRTALRMLMKRSAMCIREGIRKTMMVTPRLFSESCGPSQSTKGQA